MRKYHKKSTSHSKAVFMILYCQKENSMLNRRGFLKVSTTSVASVSLLTASGLMAACSTDTSSPSGNPLSSTAKPDLQAGPLVAQVTDVEKGEITILVGDQEFHYQNKDLVSQLLKAANL
jgi:hypothetical protein